MCKKIWVLSKVFSLTSFQLNFLHKDLHCCHGYPPAPPITSYQLNLHTWHSFTWWKGFFCYHTLMRIQCSVTSAVLWVCYFQYLISTSQNHLTEGHIWAFGHAELLLQTALSAHLLSAISIISQKMYSSIHFIKCTSCWRWPLAAGLHMRGQQTGATPSTSILDPGDQAPAILTFWEGDWKQQTWFKDCDTNERQLIFTITSLITAPRVLCQVQLDSNVFLKIFREVNQKTHNVL